MATVIPPPLKLARSSSSSPIDTPPFGLPSYSHRALPRPPQRRPRIASNTFSAPQQADFDAAAEPDKTCADTDEDSSSDSDVEQIATARIGCAYRASRVPAQIEHEHATSNHGHRICCSIDFSDRSSFTTTSPTGTYISVSQRAASIASTVVSEVRPMAVYKSRCRDLDRRDLSTASLPLQEFGAPGVERPRTVLGEGPVGRLETEADKLKRLHLCPWEALSPRTFKLKQQTSKAAQEYSEKGLPHPATERGPLDGIDRAKTLRLAATAGTVLIFILLIIDLLLLNIKLLPPAFRSSSASIVQRDVDACLAIFDLTAPSNPLSFPCSTCSTAIFTLKDKTLEQKHVMQFCALKDVYETIPAASGAGVGGTLLSKRWFASTEVCEYEGVGCDEAGLVQKITLVTPNVPSQMLQSIHWLGESLESFSVDGVGMAL